MSGGAVFVRPRCTKGLITRKSLPASLETAWCYAVPIGKRENWAGRESEIDDTEGARHDR